MAGKPSAAMESAKKAILAGKMNVNQAAVKFDVSAAYVQRQAWYRNYMADQAKAKAAS